MGLWWAIINDLDFELPLELSQGMHLLNSASILCFAEQHSISTVDLSNCSTIEEIKLCIEKIKDKIPNKKLTVAGSIRVPSLGLCPLNNDSVILSRLSCAAPCHKGNFAISDPETKEIFPIAVDGFCRMHLFKNKPLDLFNNIKTFQNIGINEFVIDFTGLSPNFVPLLLDRFLGSLNSENYLPDPGFISQKYIA